MCHFVTWKPIKTKRSVVYGNLIMLCSDNDLDLAEKTLIWETARNLSEPASLVA